MTSVGYININNNNVSVQLIVPTIGAHMQQNLKLCFAYAVIIDGLPLNAFELKEEA